MKQTEEPKVKVKISRAVRWEGEIVKVGEVLELKKSQAMELIANGKATQDLKYKATEDKPQTASK